MRQNNFDLQDVCPGKLMTLQRAVSLAKRIESTVRGLYLVLKSLLAYESNSDGYSLELPNERLMWTSVSRSSAEILDIDMERIGLFESLQAEQPSTEVAQVPKEAFR